MKKASRRRSRASGRAIFCLILLVVLFAPGVANATHGTIQTKRYLLGSTTLGLNGCDSAQGIGGVKFCNLDDPAPAMVHVTIRDDLGFRMGGLVEFCRSPPTVINCDHIEFDVVCGPEIMAVPRGTDHVRVWVGVGYWMIGEGLAAAVHADVSALVQCATATFPGTQGTVTLQWAP